MLPPLDPNALLADFIPPDDWVSPSPLRDRERGSLALNDPTGGLRQADWEGEMVGQDYWIKRLPDGTPDDVMSIAGTAIEAKFTFDLEMRPHVTWADSTSSWLYWYDPDLSGYALMELPGATSPRLTLDDKRSVALNPSVLLFYILDRQLCVRSHRDRFQSETVVGRLPFGVSGLGRVGMSVDYRLQIEFFLEPGYTNCEPVGVRLDELDLTAALIKAFISDSNLILASGIYPVEALEETASWGRLIYAWMIDTQYEQFQPHATPLRGTVIHSIDHIPHEQAPENIIPHALPLRGTVYPAIFPVPHTQAPEKFQPHATPLRGHILPGMFVRNPIEYLTSRGSVVCDINSFLTFPALTGVYRGCLIESNFVNVPSVFADPTAVTSDGGEFQYERFAELSGWLTSGSIIFRDRLQLRVESSLESLTNTTVTVTVDGQYTGEFTVTTLDCSDFSNYIIFEPLTEQPFSTYVESPSFIVPECEVCNAPISITSPGEYAIYRDEAWGDWTSEAGTVQQLDGIKVRVMTGSGFGDEVCTTLTIGAFSGEFCAETLPLPVGYAMTEGVIGLPEVFAASSSGWATGLGVIGTAQAYGTHVFGWATGQGVIGQPQVVGENYEAKGWATGLGVVGTAQATGMAQPAYGYAQGDGVIGTASIVGVMIEDAIWATTEGVIGLPQVVVEGYYVEAQVQTLGVIGTAQALAETTVYNIAVAVNHVNEYVPVFGPEYVSQVFVSHVNEYVVVQTLDKLRIGNITVEAAADDLAAYHAPTETRLLIGNVTVEAAMDDYDTYYPTDEARLRIGNVTVEVAFDDSGSYTESY